MGHRRHTLSILHALALSARTAPVGQGPRAVPTPRRRKPRLREDGLARDLSYGSRCRSQNSRQAGLLPGPRSFHAVGLWTHGDWVTS